MEKLTFAVLSDVHVTHWEDGLENLRRAITQHQAHFAPDLFVYPGDTAYMLDSPKDSVCHNIYAEPYRYIHTAMETCAPGAPAFWCMGNHEYPQNNREETITAQSRVLFETAHGQPSHFHTVHKGYHFITAPVHSWGCDVSAESQSWLMQELDKALSDTPELPVFLVLHLPLQNTWSPRAKDTYTEEFRSYLDKNPRIVAITGHCHTPIQTDRNLWQGSFTCVNCPELAVGYLEIDLCDVEIDKIFGMSQSYLFTVEGSRVEIRRYDHVADREVGTRWVFEAGTTGMYGNPALLPAPNFVPGAAFTAEVVEGGVKLTLPQRFTGDVCAEYYSVEAKNHETGETHTWRVPTQYWLADMPETVERTIPLTPPGPWRIRVRICGSFGAQSPIAPECEVRI